jgi:hypothetical protein
MKTLALVAALAAAPFVATMAEDMVMSEDLSVPAAATTMSEDMVTMTAAVSGAVSATEVSGSTAVSGTLPISDTTTLELGTTTTTLGDLAVETAPDDAGMSAAAMGHDMGSMKKDFEATTEASSSLKKATE